ncbi:hypothetical protein BC936DRAFT_138674, partial [Jimgerdemannia flammicorona]
MEESYVKQTTEVCTYFNVDPAVGLSREQVKEQQKKFGKN